MTQTVGEEAVKCGVRQEAPPQLVDAVAALNRDNPLFSYQKHHASSLHYDFRLEHEGTMVSWAVPKGLPTGPEDGNRLGVRVEDHDISYADFHGYIPDGQYGAGKVELVDIGNIEVIKWEPRYVKVKLSGTVFKGVWSLRNTKGKNWIIRSSKP